MKIPHYTKEGKFFPNSNFKTDTFYKSKDLSHLKDLSSNHYINAIRKLNNSQEALNEKGLITIKGIFEEFWPDFEEEYVEKLTREAVGENVHRMLACGDIEKGFLYYECKYGEGNHIRYALVNLDYVLHVEKI